MRTSSDNRFNSAECPFKENIRILRVDAEEAKGPTWARSLGSKMMQDEEFCMQTDSHMDFVPDWDVHMIDMWAKTNNEYAVLSTYVADSATLNENMPGHKGTNGIYEVPHLCMVTFSGSYGMVRNWGTKCLRNMNKPKITNMVWGAGLSFSKCHAERKAPYDPHTPHIFDGEEFARAIRFWTHGYDIYTPHRVYVVHNYHDSQSDPTHGAWVHSKTSWQQRSIETQQATARLRMLLEMPTEEALAKRKQVLQRDPNNLVNGASVTVTGSDAEFTPQQTLALQQSRYGLGDRRTLDQAIAFSGIDTKNRIMRGNNCGNLDFVPFTEHPWGADYIPRYDNETEAFLDVRDPGSIYFDESQRATWEAADRAYRQRKQPNQPPQLPNTRRNGPLRPSDSLTGQLPPSVSSPADTLHNVDFSKRTIGLKPVRQEMVAGRAGLNETLVANKMTINIVCIALIVLIILLRICTQQGHKIKIRKTVTRTLQAVDVENNTSKEV